MTETARCQKCGAETDKITEEMCPSCLMADLMAKKKKEKKARKTFR